MPWTSEHVAWFSKTKERLRTADGKSIEVWEFKHRQNQKILSAWAKHFRNHYCLDSEIDVLRKGTGLSRKEYLEQLKFPAQSGSPGPSIRSGDFAEILVADYLQYLRNFCVPRTRYCDKTVRNESTKGCDIIGFKVVRDDGYSPDDIMTIFEAKAQLTGASAQNRLQNAIDDSVKDQVRKAESLNALKRQLILMEEVSQADIVERFQNEEDRPYKEESGAAAVFSSSLYDKTIIKSCDASSHTNSDNLVLLVIRGDDLMTLVHELYRKAAHEA